LEVTLQFQVWEARGLVVSTYLLGTLPKLPWKPDMVARWRMGEHVEQRWAIPAEAILGETPLLGLLAPT